MQDLFAELQSFILEKWRVNIRNDYQDSVVKSEKAIRAVLEPHQLALFEAYQNADLNYCSTYETAIFHAGFRLGALLLCDVLRESS